MHRRTFIAATGVSLLAPFAPAVAQPKAGGTLVWGHSETTQNLDIHQSGTAASGRLLQNIHATLVAPDKALRPVPALAEAFETSPDLLTYTFKLRPNVTFHNGAALTSADVKYSFERVRDPKTGAVSYEVFNDVEAIETPDPLTVIVKMKRVNAPFLSRICENGAGAIIPKESGDKQ